MGHTPGHCMGRHLVRPQLGNGVAPHTHTHTTACMVTSPAMRHHRMAAPRLSCCTRAAPLGKGGTHRQGPHQGRADSARAAGAATTTPQLPRTHAPTASCRIRPTGRTTQPTRPAKCTQTRIHWCNPADEGASAGAGTEATGWQQYPQAPPPPPYPSRRRKLSRGPVYPGAPPGPPGQPLSDPPRHTASE
jgi:hypothetical protein